MKIELTWGQLQTVKDMQKRGMEVANEMVTRAFPGYQIRKVRKDAGVKRKVGND